MKNTFLALSLLFAFFANAQNEKTKVPANDPVLTDGIYARFETSKGNILIRLEYEKVPMTVANFVGLAEGNFTVLGKTIDKPFFDGLKFHRVIANFMIQGGDPDGNGTGGPGYRFYDEIDPTLNHSGPGILSMANSGPATNGSQFFITHVATPHLNGKHTVFGKLVEGQDVVNAIVQDDVMNKVTIIRIGKTAENWNATKTFETVYNKLKLVEDEKNAQFAKIAAMTKDEYKVYMLAQVQKKYPNAKQTASGLVYVIEKEGESTKPVAGSQMSVHYTGTFMDGKKFDSSRDGGTPMAFTYKTNPMIPGFEEGLAMLGKGGRGIFIIPYFDAYGAQGRPGAIPPYSDLVFDLEIMDLK
jgi:cyclophilin family peptidyl-prolyl cis-trans isomerase